MRTPLQHCRKFACCRGLLRLIPLLLTALLPVFAFSNEKVIDWVALNGGTPEKIFGDGTSFGTYEDGVATYSDYKFQCQLTVVDDRFKLKISYVNNGGWLSHCFCLTNECNLTFGEAQQIVVPYRYITPAGKGEVGQNFRLVIGSSVKNKYFGVISQETIVNDTESVLTFNISDAYAAYPSAYAQVKDSSITVMRLFPYNTGTDITTSASASSAGRSNFVGNDELYIGAFTSKWTEVTGYTASFDANGGEEVADIKTGTDGKFTFPTTTRDGWVFMGWYRDGLKYEAGVESTLVMDAEYVAAWRHEDLTQGLLSTAIDYKQELDLFKAYGSCCGMMTGDSVWYDPKADLFKSMRSGIYQIDVQGFDRGGVTNVTLTGRSGNAGNNGPKVVLPIVGVTVKDIYGLKVKYRTQSDALTNQYMEIYYKIGNTWRWLRSADMMKKSVDDEFNTVRFKFAEALGESTYETLKDSQIATWHLYPYTLSAHWNSDGASSAVPFKNGVALELARLQLIGEHNCGFTIFYR